MTTTTIRVSTETRTTLNELAHMAGVSMQEIIERAIEMYRRQQMLTAINVAYAALRTDAVAWDGLETEQADWDATLADGLEHV